MCLTSVGRLLGFVQYYTEKNECILPMLKENIIKSQLKNLAKVFCIPKVDKFQKGFMGFDIFA